MGRRPMLAAALLARAAGKDGGTAPDTEPVTLRLGVVGGASFSRQAGDGPVFQAGGARWW